MRSTKKNALRIIESIMQSTKKSTMRIVESIMRSTEKSSMRIIESIEQSTEKNSGRKDENTCANAVQNKWRKEIKMLGLKFKCHFRTGMTSLKMGNRAKNNGHLHAICEKCGTRMME